MKFSLEDIKKTSENFIDLVAKHPGKTMREYVEVMKLEHHYKTNAIAQSNLLSMLRRGKFPDLIGKYNLDTSRTHIYPVNPAALLCSQWNKKYDASWKVPVVIRLWNKDIRGVTIGPAFLTSDGLPRIQTTCYPDPVDLSLLETIPYLS